jgi:hypothetical protein
VLFNLVLKLALAPLNLASVGPTSKLNDATTSPHYNCTTAAAAKAYNGTKPVSNNP